VSLRFEVWRTVIDAHASEMASVLADRLGPVRARSVQVGHDEVGVLVEVDSGERDRWRTAWVVVVNVAELWAALDAAVAVTVAVGPVTAVTSPAAMEAVLEGCDKGAWRASCARSAHDQPDRPSLRVVDQGER
jgi:DhnA family fructose-bisphosphate aldolase class Ia